MLEPYEWKRSRTVLRRESGSNPADLVDYSPLVKRLGGQVIRLSPSSTDYVNPLDINLNYSEEENPLALKSDFVLSFCEPFFLKLPVILVDVYCRNFPHIDKNRNYR